MNGLQNVQTAIGVWLARPVAFALVGLYTAAWLAFDRESFDFHGGVALITLCMTLFIQRSEHRDTQAIHAKLDELLRSHGNARNELAAIDEAQPEQIESIRHRERGGERGSDL